MQMKRRIERALISVSDKTGLEGLARGLHAAGIEILVSGGTGKAIAGFGVPVREVSDYTGFPELMEGRVKTLHPKVHGGILARRDLDAEVMQAHGIDAIDLVVVNLYPFESVVERSGITHAEAIENIDIGGPSMIRSAAKNHEFVTVVIDPADYASVLAEVAAGGTSAELRRELATKAFARTSRYDQAINAYLSATQAPDTDLEFVSELRYGENPHQSAELFRDTRLPFEGTLVAANQLQGKALSYNNIMDADAALDCVRQFDAPCCVIVKHANPCGVACAEDIGEAWRRAFECDPVSAFGGIIAVNRPLDAATAAQILDAQFVEVLVAPAITDAAREALKHSKNLRVLEVGDQVSEERGREYRRVSGGMLVQDADVVHLDDKALQVATKRAPSQAELRDLVFAFKVVASVKSNAIVLARSARTVGIGGGQPNRVTSARIAEMRAEELGLETRGSVLASDAFFPFRDTVDAAAKMGVTAIIQPGGSMRDKESIEAANEHGMAMVFTGRRHFRH